jgi:hypothetical protein
MTTTRPAWPRRCSSASSAAASGPSPPTTTPAWSRWSPAPSASWWPTTCRPALRAGSSTADVQSRVVMGADFVACMEGADLVVRTQLTGDVRWKAPQPEGFVGLSADEDRVFIVTKESTGKRATFWLTAFAAAPARRSGAPTRPVSSARPRPRAAWCSRRSSSSGSRCSTRAPASSSHRIRGIDEKSRSCGQPATRPGSALPTGRSGSTSARPAADAPTRRTAKLALPPQLAKATFAPDAYDPVQAGYSAADRTRILWRGDSQADGPLKFTGGVAVHYFRFILGYDTAGALTWAYSHPRVELVASEHVGSVMMAVSASGEIIGARSVHRRAAAHRAARHQAGARARRAFDADGWEPPGQAQAGAGTWPPWCRSPAIVTAASTEIKELAVAALAKLPDASVTADLLALLDDPRTSAKLKDLVSSVLVTRKDPAGLPALLASLGKRTDFIEGTPRTPWACWHARWGARGETSLDAGDRSRAVGALTAHLRAPATPLMDLVDVINAIGALGGRDASDALRAHLMMYRVDRRPRRQPRVGRRGGRRAAALRRPRGARDAALRGGRRADRPGARRAGVGRGHAQAVAPPCLRRERLASGRDSRRRRPCRRDPRARCDRGRRRRGCRRGRCRDPGTRRRPRIRRGPRACPGTNRWRRRVRRRRDRRRCSYPRESSGCSSDASSAAPAAGVSWASLPTVVVVAVVVGDAWFPPQPMSRHATQAAAIRDAHFMDWRLAAPDGATR